MGVVACQPLASDNVGTPATVTWIYDGDTVEVETDGGLLDVRILGVNAPESDECYGNEALNNLIDTLKGRPVEIESVGTDQFGRTLAHVYLEGDNVGRELVEQGFAIALTSEENRHDYVPAEGMASTNGRGLWGTEICGESNPIPALSIDFDRFDEVATVTNDEASTVDLSGWVIRDESSRHRFRFLSGALIHPNETRIIRTGDPGWEPGDANVWNNDGDMAMLLDRAGRVVDHVRQP